MIESVNVFHVPFSACKLTRGAWIAKDSGHVIRAKNIVEGGPNGYSLHVEISHEVIRSDGGRFRRKAPSTTGIARVGATAPISISFGGIVTSLLLMHDDRVSQQLALAFAFAQCMH